MRNKKYIIITILTCALLQLNSFAFEINNLANPILELANTNRTEQEKDEDDKKSKKSKKENKEKADKKIKKEADKKSSEEVVEQQAKSKGSVQYNNSKRRDKNIVVEPVKAIPATLNSTSVVITPDSATTYTSYKTLLNGIETNSKTLLAAKFESEAEKLSNKTGIYLSDPEFEFGYSWGGGEARKGKEKIDFNVTQSFEFPSVYVHQKKKSKMMDETTDFKYQETRRIILLEAEQLCIEIISYNILQKLYLEKKQTADELSSVYEKMLAEGDVNILEYNKIRMLALAAKNDLLQLDIQRNDLLSQLQALNGGVPVNLLQDKYDINTLPDDFETWYTQALTKSAEVRMAETNTLISERNKKLSVAKNLPVFSAGYKGEDVFEGGFNGIGVGLSIPLWENKNTVKQAKQALLAAETQDFDVKLGFRSNVLNLYNKASQLKTMLVEYNTSMSALSDIQLARKAFDLGEISLIQYLLDLQYYIDLYQQLYEIEKNLALTVAEFYSIDL